MNLPATGGKLPVLAQAVSSLETDQRDLPQPLPEPRVPAARRRAPPSAGLKTLRVTPSYQWLKNRLENS